MSTSKTKVLQKAFLFLTTERSFQKRWVSLSSIESALRLRYPFGDHYNFDRAMLSKSLGNPKIDSLQDPNGLGVYRCKMSQGYFFTIQDPTLAPPEMLTTHANNSEWIRLCKVDQELLSSYGKKVKSSEHRENNYDRHTKKKQKVLDDIDIFLANKKSKHSTTKICMDGSPPVCEAPAAAIEPQEEKKEEMSTPTPFYKKRISLLLLSCSLLQSLVVLVQELLCLVETAVEERQPPVHRLPQIPRPKSLLIHFVRRWQDCILLTRLRVPQTWRTRLLRRMLLGNGLSARTNSPGLSLTTKSPSTKRHDRRRYSDCCYSLHPCCVLS